MADTKETKQKIELATAWVTINDVGSNIRRTRISPAEAVIIRSQFGVKVEGEAKPLSPITHLQITENVERTQEEDFKRLFNYYGKNLMEKVFPGENPKIPVTFKEAGFDETEEAEPKKGKSAHQYVELAKLPKEEVTDEKSVADAAKAKASQSQIDQLVAQNKQLSDQVTQLLAKLQPAK